MDYILHRDKSVFNDDETDVDDETLVRAAKKDRSKFAPLYRRYMYRVYQYIYSRIGNVPETEDLTAQVFEDALKSLPKYHPQGRFAGWLFTLAFRRCADYYRRPKPEPINEKFPSGSCNDPIEQVITEETYRRLASLLSELKEEERELLRLHFAARLTYSEIAYVLRRNEGAIKMSMSRLIQRLKARWEVTNE